MNNEHNNLSIPTQEEILKLRNFLNQISHISYSYAKISKQYPLEVIDEKQAKELIDFYKNLFSDLSKTLEGYHETNGKIKP